MHYALVVTPKLRGLLDKLRVHLTELDGAQDPFDLIYAWLKKAASETAWRYHGEKS